MHETDKPRKAAPMVLSKVTFIASSTFQQGGDTKGERTSLGAKGGDKGKQQARKFFEISISCPRLSWFFGRSPIQPGTCDSPTWRKCAEKRLPVLF